MILIAKPRKFNPTKISGYTVCNCDYFPMMHFLHKHVGFTLMQLPGTWVNVIIFP